MCRKEGSRGRAMKVSVGRGGGEQIKEEWKGGMIRKLAELETGIGIRDVGKERGIIRGDVKQG